MTDSPITVDCQFTGCQFDFHYDLDNTLEMFMSDLQDQEPPMGPYSPFSPGAYVFINGNLYPIPPNHRATLSSLGATAHSMIVVSDAVVGGYPPAPSGLKTPITVDCHITGQRWDFDYDLDNTLEIFLRDLQDQEPPMGFSPLKAKYDPTAGVFVNGNAHIFSASPQATLSSLGATTNSIIIVTDFAHADGGPPPAPSGLKNKRARMTLTSKRARKPIVKRTHVGLISVDIDALSDFEVVKLAALNGFNESLSGGGVQQRIGELKSWLRKLKSKGSVRTKVPDKFQDKSVETAIGLSLIHI